MMSFFSIIGKTKAVLLFTAILKNDLVSIGTIS